MKRTRLTEEQIILMLIESEAGAKNDDVCRRHSMNSATFSNWPKNFDGIDASHVKRPNALVGERLLR